MADETLDIVRLQLDRLRQENEKARIARETAMKTVAACDQTMARNAVKIEALEEIIEAASVAECEDQEPEEPNKPPATPHARPNGETKLKASGTVYRYIEHNGPATREQLLGLADKIASDSNNKRHIMQTTVYLLTKRGKIVEGDDGKFRRVEQEAD